MREASVNTIIIFSAKVFYSFQASAFLEFIFSIFAVGVGSFVVLLNSVSDVFAWLLPHNGEVYLTHVRIVQEIDSNLKITLTIQIFL